jgi:hypothetical protein
MKTISDCFLVKYTEAKYLPHCTGNHHEGQLARSFTLGEKAIEVELVNKGKEAEV